MRIVLALALLLAACGPAKDDRTTLTIPAQATLGIFTFLHAWNDYWWPLISATNKQMFTLTVGIASTQMNFAQTEGLGFLMAQAVFAGLPILIVYLFFQKYIIQAVAGAAGR